MSLGVAAGALITSEAQTVLAYLSAKWLKGFLQPFRNIMILLMKCIWICFCFNNLLGKKEEDLGCLKTCRWRKALLYVCRVVTLAAVKEMPLQKASGSPCPSAWCWLGRPSEPRCFRWSIFLTKSWYSLSLWQCWRVHLPSLQFLCCPTFCGSVAPSLLMFVKRSIFIFPVEQLLYLLYHFIGPCWYLWLCYILS